MITKNNIDQVVEIVNEMRESESYYNLFGLSLFISVTNDSKIVLSSKHWIKNCYIDVRSDKGEVIEGNDLWDIITKSISQPFERYEHVTWYVFIPNLNKNDTNGIYNAIIAEIKKRNLNTDTVETWDFFGWKITQTNACKIPWLP
jgi:hypothetical protein